jgi:hypothetical protein
MKEIISTAHLILRMKVRKIPDDYPEKIFLAPEKRYFDSIEKTNIYIKRLMYNNKVRIMMIACEETADLVRIITIHPVREENIINRVVRGRWMENE